MLAERNCSMHTLFICQLCQESKCVQHKMMQVTCVPFNKVAEGLWGGSQTTSLYYFMQDLLTCHVLDAKDTFTTLIFNISHYGHISSTKIYRRLHHNTYYSETLLSSKNPGLQHSKYLFFSIISLLHLSPHFPVL